MGYGPLAVGLSSAGHGFCRVRFSAGMVAVGTPCFPDTKGCGRPPCTGGSRFITASVFAVSRRFGLIGGGCGSVCRLRRLAATTAKTTGFGAATAPTSLFYAVSSVEESYFIWPTGLAGCFGSRLAGVLAAVSSVRLSSAVCISVTGVARFGVPSPVAGGLSTPRSGFCVAVRGASYDPSFSCGPVSRISA